MYILSLVSNRPKSDISIISLLDHLETPGSIVEMNELSELFEMTDFQAQTFNLQTSPAAQALRIASIAAFMSAALKSELPATNCVAPAA